MKRSNTAENISATSESSDAQLKNLEKRLDLFAPGRRLDDVSSRFLSKLYATATTIHACRTLLPNLPEIPKLVQTVQRRYFTSAEAESAEQRAFAALIRVGERHEPRKAKFLTYAFHRMRGLAKDILKSRRPTGSLDDDGKPVAVYGSIAHREGYAPGGQKSVLPVPSDDWFVEHKTDTTGDRIRELLDQAGQNQRTRLVEREYLILQNEISRAKPWKELARRLGLSEQAMSMARKRLKNKLRETR